MDKLKMQTANKVSENVERIAALFPNCVTESIGADGKPIKVVDFDLLRQELSGFAVGGQEERYQFTWADKKKSILLANSPISKTLRPCRAESVNFETTKNLYIEGDNLDVLKTLQETYMGRVKMIYIDPPYNTGSDFVYEDDFSISAEEYFVRSSVTDDEGNRLLQNNDTNGRFHTDWLNMIYPRLKLAKDLLTEDGVIFISIDDYEVHNLRKVCDEIFGAGNFIGEFAWRKKVGAGADARLFFRQHEYILFYAKQIQSLTNFFQALTQEQKNAYSNPDNDPRGAWAPTDLSAPAHDNDPKRIYDIVAPSGKRYRKCWAYTKANMENLIADNLVWYGPNGDSMPKRKRFLSDKKGLTPRSWIDSILTQDGKKDLDDIGLKVFDYPKPTKLIKNFLDIADTQRDAIVLDFFSGSATTAHAVIQLNAEDGGNRRFICVQLPEETPDGSEAQKEGYKTICEIGKERIRRAGKKIAEEYALTAPRLDVGFRVLKLDTSNMKPVFYNPDSIGQDLIAQLESNIKDDRMAEDLLFQVMLDMGIELSSDIKVETIDGKTIYTVGGDNLVCCFDTGITKEVVTTIAKIKPLYAIFRDSGFERDDTLVSFDQIFETYSPTTERRVL